MQNQANKTETSADKIILKSLIETSGLVAELIRRSGASYGSAEDWRRDFTAAVEATNALVRLQAGEPRCEATNYNGDRCTTHAGHAGDHSV
jgi:hypothetical protein